MDSRPSSSPHRHSKTVLAHWLKWPAKALFRAIRAKKVAKFPSPTTIPNTRLKSAKVILNFRDSVNEFSLVTNGQKYGNSLPVVMDQDYTSESWRVHDTLACGSGPPVIGTKPSTASNASDLSALSDMISTIFISIPDKTNLSGRLAELPIPVFKPSIWSSVVTREPMKASPERFEGHSLSPGIPASYASSEPRGIKRKSPDDALTLSPQSDKKLLCPPARKWTPQILLKSDSLVLHYTKAQSIASILQVHVKRCSPDSCFSYDERPKKRTRTEEAETMDVDCPTQNIPITSSNGGSTMVSGACEGYNNVTAIRCPMKVCDWQAANGVPEVRMDNNDGDNIDIDMEIDAEATTSRGTGTVGYSAFKQIWSSGRRGLR